LTVVSQQKCLGHFPSVPVSTRPRFHVNKGNQVPGQVILVQIANPPQPGAVTHGPPQSGNFLSIFEGELALVIIGLGVVVIIALSIALHRKEASAEDATRAYALVLIIIGTIVLICAGYSNDQIAPAMGLFGTVAGYLLGRKAG
jgi:hypothetical protein